MWDMFQEPPWIPETMSSTEPYTHSTSSLNIVIGALIHLTCTSLGCGRKLEYPEKTHADMGACADSMTVTLAGNRHIYKVGGDPPNKTNYPLEGGPLVVQASPARAVF